MKRTIEKHLNSENHIQIARKCMKSLAELLGCRLDSVKIEGNTSYIDFNRSVPMSIQFITNNTVPAVPCPFCRRRESNAYVNLVPLLNLAMTVPKLLSNPTKLLAKMCLAK